MPPLIRNRPRRFRARVRDFWLMEEDDEDLGENKGYLSLAEVSAGAGLRLTKINCYH
jgi:hypothetical protein